MIMGKKSGRFTLLASLVTASALYVGVAVAQVPSINVGSADPGANNKAVIDITLASNGANVGGTQNTIVFDNTVLSLASADCKINPAIGLSPQGAEGAQCADDPSIGPCKNLSKTIKPCGTSPQPLGCPSDAGTNLSVVNAIVAATAAPNTNPIPDGVLYTCTFTVTNAAGLPTSLGNLSIVASDPTGHQLCSGSATPCGGTGGSIPTGGAPPTNTPRVTPPTNTPTVTPPTNTPGVTPATNTPVVVATATPTATDTPGGGGPSFEDSDGCHIGTTATGFGWWLLIPAVGLLVIRRRRR